jgi:hypothetical protein
LMFVAFTLYVIESRATVYAEISAMPVALV